MDMERSLNLGFGFPAVVAVSPSKQKVAIMKASFSENNFSEFLSDLMSGRTGLDDLKAKLSFKSSEAWDGKDATPIEEEGLYNDDL